MTYQRKLERDIRRPLEYGLEVFGGKWKSQIICVPAHCSGSLAEMRLQAAGLEPAFIQTSKKTPRRTPGRQDEKECVS